MLNKVKIGAIIAAILLVLRVYLPDLAIPAGLEDALMMVIVFVSQFFIKETPATVERLTLK